MTHDTGYPKERVEEREHDVFVPPNEQHVREDGTPTEPAEPSSGPREADLDPDRVEAIGTEAVPQAPDAAADRADRTLVDTQPFEPATPLDTGSAEDAERVEEMGAVHETTPTELVDDIGAEDETHTVDTDADVDAANVDRSDVDSGHANASDMGVGNVEGRNVEDVNVDSGHVDSGHVDSGHVDSGDVDSGHVDGRNVDADDAEVRQQAGDHMDADHMDAEHMDAEHMDASNVDPSNVEVRDVEDADVQARKIDAGEVDDRDVDWESVEARNVEASNVDSTNVDATNVDAADVDAANVYSVDGRDGDVDSESAQGTDVVAVGTASVPEQATTPSAEFWPAGIVDDLRDRWDAVQMRFVDDPSGVAADAKALVGDALSAIRDAIDRLEARLDEGISEATDDTEELRQRVGHYRNVFESLLRR